MEWCEPNEQIPGRLSTSSVEKTRDEVEHEFTKRKNDFTLYVDETDSLILADRIIVGWDDLDSRHLRFLYLVLTALHRYDTIHHRHIAKKALQNEHADDVAIRRVKSELNSKLHGTINQFVRADRRMHRYEVKLFPYCWIRYAGASSRLYSEDPV